MKRKLIAPAVLYAVAACVTPSLLQAAEAATTQASVPQTQPSAPTTAPAAIVNISSDAQTLLDDAAKAYGKLQSLQLVGVFKGHIDAAGQQTGGEVPFTSSFRAPNQFRHDGKDDMLFGSDGKQTYAYAVHDNMFARADAPKEKISTRDLPKGFAQMLTSQDPSLQLALARDPMQEITDNATDVSKAVDTQVGNANYPTVHVKLKDKTTLDIAFDGDSHLIRQTRRDVSAILAARNIPMVKEAMYVIDYSDIKPDSPASDDQFAWTPPAGAKDIKDVKAPAPVGDDGAPTELVGKDVPDFKLSGLDGKMVGRADLKGKVTVLDFWATWCPPCRASLPHLDEMYQAEKATGLLVYAINLQEEKPAVEAFVTKTKLGVPILLDTDGKAAELFKVDGIPETVVVGKDGKVVKVIVGFAAGTPDDLKKAVDDAMKK